MNAVVPCICGEAKVGAIVVAGLSRGGDRVEIRRCPNCGLCRTWPQPDVALLEETDYQGDTDVRHHVSNLRRFRAYARNLLRVLESHVPAGPRNLLDVGCNVGALILEAQQWGWTSRGIDINKRAIAYGRDVLGLDAENASIEDLRTWSATFQAVTLTQVLEHLPRPHEAIRALLNITAPGGVVAIESPNMDGLFPRLLGAAWYGYGVKQHLWHFTAQTIGVVAKAADAELVAVTSRSNLDYGLPLMLIDIPARLFNCGDNLVAVFKKRE
ncbi:class I SAM-dependent methyltransferase [bacterium]|nr:MAG: class I SAM-dependent methyltransferase [bacterium]